MKQHNWVMMGLLLAGLIVLIGQPTAVSSKLRGVMVNLGTPFVQLADHIPSVHSRRELAEDNRRLRAENNLLAQQVNALAETGREYLELRRLLNFQQHVHFRAVGATVIGRDASNWWKSLQIDRGLRDGLRDNLPVVNAEGVVGKIVRVTPGESRVLLLVDPNCKVSGLLQDCREPGVVSGIDAAFGRTPSCVMTFVDRGAQIKPGETVITSGMGGLFPKGLRIGVVAARRLNRESGLYQDVEVKPAVNFLRLERVMVILGSE